MADSALISVEPGFTPRSGAVYSVGIHPWHSAGVTDTELRRLDADARLGCVKAIGETGLDRLRGASPELQTELLMHHIRLSEELNKPLVLHVVRTFPEIIAMKKKLRPAQPWIIHGFRGKRRAAEELLRHGFYLSFGEKFNADAALAVPSDRLLVETDDSPRLVADLATLHPQLDPTLPLRLLDIGHADSSFFETENV